MELGSGTFYFRPQNNVVLEAGNRYKYTVKVNATGLTLEGCTIGDWADGGGESGAAELGYIYDSNTNTYTVYNADGLLGMERSRTKRQIDKLHPHRRHRPHGQRLVTDRHKLL